MNTNERTGQVAWALPVISQNMPPAPPTSLWPKRASRDKCRTYGLIGIVFAPLAMVFTVGLFTIGVPAIFGHCASFDNSDNSDNYAAYSGDEHVASIGLCDIEQTITNQAVCLLYISLAAVGMMFSLRALLMGYADMRDMQSGKRSRNKRRSTYHGCIFGLFGMMVNGVVAYAFLTNLTL